jgi:hypothetical protein
VSGGGRPMWFASVLRLDDGCEVELVARSGKAPQTHALEAMMDLQVRKAHLDFLALIARSVERFGDLRRNVAACVAATGAPGSDQV